MNKPPPIFIGIAGRAGSGKDPAALTIAGCLPGPSSIIPLATGLKNMMAAHYGILPGTPAYFSIFFTNQGKRQPSPNPLKPGNTVRDDLINLGDVTRSLNEDIWVDDCYRRGCMTESEFVIVPDLRRSNEIRIMDWMLWIGEDTVGEHPTEAELSSKDFCASLRFQQDTVSGRLDAIRKWTLDNRLSIYGSLKAGQGINRASMADDMEERVIHPQLAAGSEISRAKAYTSFDIKDPLAPTS